jgi:hypothetical protein
MATFIPKRVFIVPYRNRIEHKFFFSKHMTFLLEDNDDYEIYFTHQFDKRPFNRGAMKNIGFLAMKQKYPNDYHNITFIFNDVDTMPFHKLFSYDTIQGKVMHHYGFENALGGIVVIKGIDFEKTNGYPNYWGWGMEDTCFQYRCLQNGLLIDRSQFLQIGNSKILQLFDGVARLVTKQDTFRLDNNALDDGLKTIHNLLLSIDPSSRDPLDNVYVVDSKHLFYVNVLNFSTLIRYNSNKYHTYDLRANPNEVAEPLPNTKNVRSSEYVITTENWKKIPESSRRLPIPDRENEKMIRPYFNLMRRR